jgi:hypothetical protein
MGHNLADAARAAVFEWAEANGVPADDWGWHDEHGWVTYQVGIEFHDLAELAECVERPAQLMAHVEAAAVDESFDQAYEEWLVMLVNANLALAIEQGCDDQGLLLGSDMRALRWRTVPDESRHALSVFMSTCPRHVRALVVHDLFWMVRFERARRTGSPVLCLSLLRGFDDDARG